LFVSFRLQTIFFGRIFAKAKKYLQIQLWFQRVRRFTPHKFSVGSRSGLCAVQQMVLLCLAVKSVRVVKNFSKQEEI
jgi:hypothetical protein